jgi:transcriptional regulator with XRE-family HTH domain
MRKNLPSDFALRLKRLRASAGLTQSRLAELIGVSFASINRWENGQTRPSALARVQDPFAALLVRARGGVVISEQEVCATAEVENGVEL